MANTKVTLVRYCKTKKGWRRHQAVIGRNGRVRPGFVMVDGKQREYPEGHYELRYYEGAKPKFDNVGDNAADALTARVQKVHLLSAIGSATLAGAKIIEEPGRVPLRRQLNRFVQAAEDRGASVAARVYRLAVEEFLATTSKTYADQINADDVALHQRLLRKRGCGDRTIVNRHRAVKAFLRDAGVAVASVMRVSPRAEKTLPEVYTKAEIEALFSSLRTTYHTVIFEILLKTGLRDQEAQFLFWSDIRWEASTLTVRSKPDLGFEIKDKEERSIPIPSDLLANLRTLRTKNPKARFVLGTSSDKPNTKLLRLLKRLVRAAGLNCGSCNGCVTTKECEQWFLHKFRSTYATMLLRNGVDIRTVQKWMGHSDLESTMRYLRPEEDAHMQARVNVINWGM